MILPEEFERISPSVPDIPKIKCTCCTEYTWEMTTWLLTPAFSPLHQGFHKLFILHTPTQAVPYFFDQNWPQNIGLLELLHHMFPSPYATVIFQIDHQDMFEGILKNCCGWRFSVGYQDWSYRWLWSELKGSENLICSCIWRIIVSHKTDGGFIFPKIHLYKNEREKLCLIGVSDISHHQNLSRNPSPLRKINHIRPTSPFDATKGAQ